MKIDALKLLDGPITVDVNESVHTMEVDEDPSYRFVDGMTGRVVFSRVINKVLARGTVRTRIQSECVRCLEPVEVPLETEVTLVYANDPELLDEKKRMDFPDDVLYFDGHVIEPLKDLRDALFLELPAYPTCDLVPGKKCAKEELKFGPVTFGPKVEEEVPPPPEESEQEPRKADWKSVLRRVSETRDRHSES